MPNNDALWATLHHVEANPETLDQGRWHCKTAFCFAGHATVTVLGARVDDIASVVLTPTLVDLMNTWERSSEDYDAATAPLAWNEECRPTIGTFAQAVLGLSKMQADVLFSGDNTLAMLRRTVEKITGESR